MTFAAGKHAKTTHGRDVEIIAVLPQGKELHFGEAIVGIITWEPGNRTVESWTAGGRYAASKQPTSLDLVMPPKIATSHVYPPIPARSFDWCAWYDDDEPNDAGGMDRGWGPTEVEAIADLTENYPREEAEAA